MRQRIASVVAVLTLAALSLTIAASTDDRLAATDLTIHEWGTFTSVAGIDGKTAQWLPLAGSADLPCFVNFFQNRLLKAGGPLYAEVQKNPVDYAKARSQLLGPVRMETPVVYFYSDKPQTVDVRVAFRKGFITEWYPQATVNQTPVRLGVLTKSADTGATITWKKVEVLPAGDRASFPEGASASHYYAARETDANPLRISGQNEKFLFYRGVGGFPIPLNVTAADDGRIHIRYLAGKPAAILFESRGGKLGYTVVDTSKNDVVLSTPSLTGDFASLRQELESTLVRQGLYAKEAKAMVDTWRDSWFEEGTRLFYIVPASMVDEILPLTIEPRPARTVRVFVGRVEIITPATIKAVENAVNDNDPHLISTYGRFLGPIMDRLPVSSRSRAMLDAAFSNYLNQASNCSK
jgi:hypothetical protein